MSKSTEGYRRAVALNHLHAAQQRVLSAWRVVCALQDFKTHPRTGYLADAELRDAGSRYVGLRDRLFPELAS